MHPGESHLLPEKQQPSGVQSDGEQLDRTREELSVVLKLEAGEKKILQMPQPRL